MIFFIKLHDFVARHWGIILVILGAGAVLAWVH